MSYRSGWIRALCTAIWILAPACQMKAPQLPVARERIYILAHVPPSDELCVQVGTFLSCVTVGELRTWMKDWRRLE